MLTVNEAGQFVLYARDAELAKRAERAALDRSIPATARRGYPVFFSGSPYAVVQFWQQADEAARAALGPLKAQIDRSFAITSSRCFAVPASCELMPFQVAGVAYAVDTPGGVLIGDEMGLGKTAQAIVVANELQAQRVLAVVPGGTRAQWAEAIQAWSTHLHPYINAIYRAKDHGVHASHKWTLISYELLNNPIVYENIIKELQPDLLIIDEAHYLKTVDSKRTRNVFGRLDEPGTGIAAQVPKTLCLTGTPLPNRPKEGYTLCRSLAWESIDFMSEKSYGFSFNPSIRTTELGQDGTWRHRFHERSGRLLELQARLRGTFMVRRLEANVQTQLPKERYHITYLEPDGEIRKVLKAEEPLLLRISDFEDLEGLSIAEQAHISTLRREMGVAKVPRLLEHIRSIMEGSEGKLVVFAYHRDVLRLLYQGAESWGPLLMWGGMSPSATEAARQRFMRDPAARVLFGQITKSGTGLDGLQTVCSHALFAEFDWVPGVNAQAVRRLKRIGQERSVLAEFAIAPGGLCERILSKSLDKLATITTALD